MDNPLSYTKPISPYNEKQPEIKKMTVSWKRFTNMTEGDCEGEESLFEDQITSTCAMFYI